MIDAVRRNPTGALALCVAVLLPACKSAEVIPKIPGLEPYRITIQQGNYLSQEMVAQLKVGMTREQVRFVLGTPLLQDVFHADRWDYVFYREVPGRPREQRNLSVVFEKDRLARVIGDLVPPEGAAPQPTGFVPQVKPDAPAATAKPAPAAPQPAAGAAKPAAEPPRPGFDLARPSGEPATPAAEPAKPAAAAEPVQNWSAASDEPAEGQDPARKPAPGAEPAAKPADDAKKAEDKTDEQKQERGWFGRMLEKIGL